MSGKVGKCLFTYAVTTFERNHRGKTSIFVDVLFCLHSAKFVNLNFNFDLCWIQWSPNRQHRLLQWMTRKQNSRKRCWLGFRKVKSIDGKYIRSSGSGFYSNLVTIPTTHKAFQFTFFFNGQFFHSFFCTAENEINFPFSLYRN